MKSYGQQCPVTRALDLVGDRWTLVIVRDLLDGPRRFGRLRGELVGISPSLLSERLGRLTDSGLVVSGPDGYELTERGRALAPIVDALGRWGVELMDRDHGAAGDVFHEHFRRLGLRFALRAEALPGEGCSIEADIDGARFVLDVAPAGVHERLSIRSIEPAEGADPSMAPATTPVSDATPVTGATDATHVAEVPLAAGGERTSDVSLRSDIASVYAIRRGRRTVEELEAAGRLRLAGDPTLVEVVRSAIAPLDRR